MSRTSGATVLGRWKLAWQLALLLLIGALAFEVLAVVRLIVTTYDPAPWFDEWTTLSVLRRLHAEPGHWWALLSSQHNEHRLFFPRLVYLVDYSLFGGRQTFTLASRVCLLGANALLLAAVVGRAGALPRAPRAATILACACLLFSGHQASNFVWSFQVSWFLMMCTASVAVAGLVTAARTGRSPTAQLAIVLCSSAAAIVSQFSIAGGLLVWPVLWGLALLVRRRLCATALLTLVVLGAGSILLYLHGLHLDDRAGLNRVRASPLGVVAFVLAYLGGPLADFGTLAVYVAGTLMLTGATYFVVALVRRSEAASSVEFFCTSIVAFVCLLAAVTSVARAHFGAEGAMESRYATAALAGMASLLVLVVSRVFRWTATRSGSYANPIALLLVLGVGTYGVASHLRLPYDYRPLPELKRETASAVIVNVQDAAALSRAGFPLNVPDAVERNLIRTFLLRDQRGIFRDPGAASLGRFIQKVFPIQAGGCQGNVDSIEWVGPAEQRGLRVTGWAWDTPGGVPFSAIVFANEQGRIVGLGYPGLKRPDVPAAVPGAGSVTGWVAHIRSDGAVFRPWGVRLSGTSLCMFTADVRAPTD